MEATKKEKYKNLAIRVTPEMQTQIKIRVATLGVSLQDYLTNLIKKDLEISEKTQ